MKAHGDVDARVHIYTATAPGRGRVASPTLGHLYSRGNPRYSFYRRLSGHKGVKKNLHPSDTRDRTRAVQPIAKRWTDLKKSEKIPGAPAWRRGEWIWLTGPSGLHRNLPQGISVPWGFLTRPEIRKSLSPFVPITLFNEVNKTNRGL